MITLYQPISTFKIYENWSFHALWFYDSMRFYEILWDSMRFYEILCFESLNQWMKADPKLAFFWHQQRNLSKAVVGPTRWTRNRLKDANSQYVFGHLELTAKVTAFGRAKDGTHEFFWLVVTGCHEFFIFPEILGMSSSQLTFIFFRGVAQPPTSFFRWVFRRPCPQEDCGCGSIAGGTSYKLIWGVSIVMGVPQ